MTMDDDIVGAGGLATLVELPRLLGQMLRWWVRHVLPFLYRPWESRLNISDRVPHFDAMMREHARGPCDAARWCAIHGDQQTQQRFDEWAEEEP